MIAWSLLCICERARMWIYHPAVNQRITSAHKNAACSIHYIWFTLAPESQGAFTSNCVHTQHIKRRLCCNGLFWIHLTFSWGFRTNVLFINNATGFCLKETFKLMELVRPNALCWISLFGLSHFYTLKCSSIRGCGLWSKLAIKEELMMNSLECFYISAAGTFLEPFLASKCKVQITWLWYETLTVRRRYCLNQSVWKGVYEYIWQQMLWMKGVRVTEHSKNRKGMHMVFIVTLG